MDITQARQIAVQAHADQKYDDGPYTDHLDEVVRILREYGFDEPHFIATGYLHDVLEDTPHDARWLHEQGTPWLVVSAVEFCTDEDGPNRKTRKALTYQRVEADKTKGGESVDIGLVCKWADRLANLRSSVRSKPGLLQMYRKEGPSFRAAYAPVGVMAEHPRLLAMISEYDRIIEGAAP